MPAPSVIMALGMKLNLIYTFVRAYEKEKTSYNACGELFAEEKLVCPRGEADTEFYTLVK